MLTTTRNKEKKMAISDGGIPKNIIERDTEKESELDLSKIFREEFGKALLSCFTKIGIPTFIGGSRRFGYANSRSNIDIFILDYSDFWPEEMVSLLGCLNIKPKLIRTVGTPWDAELIISNLAKIRIFSDKEKFQKAMGEHEQMEKFLQTDEIFLKLVRGFAEDGKPGDEIYTIIRDFLA